MAMDPQMLKQKMKTLMQPCPCGSGKMYYVCCGTDEAASVGGEMCPCGSGKMVKDCCMKSPDAHKGMM